MLRKFFVFTGVFLVAFFLCLSLAQSTSNPLIIEVYYDVAPEKGKEGENEWLKIFNPSAETVELAGWQICDNHSCQSLPPVSLTAGGLAIITGQATTWDYWIIADEAIKITLAGKIGNGLANDGDRVVLKNAQKEEVDAMSYGTDTNVFDPSCPDVNEGHSLKREPFDQDTNQASDFVDNPLPSLAILPTVSLRDQKEAVKNGLEKAKTGDEAIDQKIEVILAFLEKGLDENHWQDENHLDSQKGREVFQAEAWAISRMRFYLRWLVNPLPESVQSALEKATAELVKIDKSLAEEAIKEASETKLTWIIKWLARKMVEAQSLSTSNPDRAVSQYGFVWSLAQKAKDMIK